MTDPWNEIAHPIVAWVNKEKNWLTKQIHPINQRLLIVEIAAAIRGSQPETIGEIDGVFPLEIKPESDVVRVAFSDFVSFSVTEEMFSQHNAQEISEGAWLKILSKSLFLEFVEQSTWATSDFPGRLIHYQINTLDHTINIVTSNPPEIERLNL